MLLILNIAIRPINVDGAKDVSVSNLTIQRAKLKDLPSVYAIYFEAFKQPTMQGDILFDVPERRIENLSILKTLAIHLFHIILERLNVVCQEGNLFSIFRNNLDMVPFKVVINEEIVGFFFLKKFNSKVFEVGLIGFSENKRGLGFGSKTIDLITQHVKKMGARRLIVRASGIKQVKGFFNKSGFKQSFSEGVFFLDVS